VLNVTGQSPFRDRLVRQAANYAVDRDGLVKLLNGSATPATGLYRAGHPVFGDPQNHYAYDPEKSKALLKQAGYTAPVKAKIMISTSGSGQMMPLPMNEFLQQSMQAAGFTLDFEVVEWGAMLLGLPQRAGCAGLERGRRVEHQPQLHRPVIDVPLLAQHQLFAQ
jgi:peptide/nickel transport system substrate-binding protein